MLLLAALLLLAAVWLPNPQASILLHQRAIAQTIEEQVAALEALTEEIMANPELSAAEKEALLEPLQTAIESLQNDDLNQAQAVAVLSEAEADLRSLSQNEATNLLQNLNAAGQPLAGNANAQALGQALQSGNLAPAGSPPPNWLTNYPASAPPSRPNWPRTWPPLPPPYKRLTPPWPRNWPRPPPRCKTAMLPRPSKPCKPPAAPCSSAPNKPPPPSRPPPPLANCNPAGNR